MSERRADTYQLIARATEIRVGLQTKVDELLFFIEQLRHHLNDGEAEGDEDDAQHA
jgi:hypothetical protein